MQTGRTVWGAVAAILTAVLGAAVPAAPAEAQERTLKIGAPLPLTGALAPEGLKQKEGYDLWAEQVAKTGGIKVGGGTYKVQIIYDDYQSSTPAAVQLVDRMITQDKVNFIFSPFGSGATKATSTVAERYEIPQISSTASSAEVYEGGFKYLFGILNSNQIVARAFTSYMKVAAPAVKKIAVYSRNDLFPLSLASSLEAEAKAQGYEIIYSAKYPINAADHSSAVTELRATKADWIYVTGYVDDLIRIRKQMADLKVTAPVITMVAGPAYPEFAKALGPVADNVTSITWWHPAVKITSPDVFGSSQSFVDLFTAKYNKSPDYAQAASSAAGVVLQEAIEKAGSIAPEKVKDALASTIFQTFYGPIQFGPGGQNATPGDPVFQIQNGAIVVLAPANVKQGTLALMK